MHLFQAFEVLGMIYTRKIDRSFQVKTSVSNIVEETEMQESQCDPIQCITRFLKETSLENKIAFEQVDLLQQPQVKVAKALNIPLSTLKSRVQRTRKYLRLRIEECCPDYREKCV